MGWLAILAGCNSHPPGILGIVIDAQGVGEAIVQACDKNHDGLLSADELAAVPPIRDNRNWYDTDNDGLLSANEVRAGLNAIFDPKVGLLSYSCRVLHNGKPLSGAQVKFVPLPELKDVVPVASGVTDEFGAVELNLAPEARPANTPPRIAVMRAGLYLVQVTHPDSSIPDKYNANTTLGAEVSRFTTAGTGKTFRLDF